MRMQECVLLLSLGLVIWILGTIYYAYTGHRVLETTPIHYWASFAISPIISAALCILILCWRHIAPSNWAVAMLLLAIPGMVGEAVVLSTISGGARTSSSRRLRLTVPARSREPRSDVRQADVESLL